MLHEKKCAEESQGTTASRFRTHRSRLTGAIIAATLLVVLPALQAEADCQDRLDNRVYRCSVKSDAGSSFNECFRFTSPGNQSENFDLALDGLDGTAMSCDCQAEGNFSNPEFGEADSFHCVTPPFFNLGLAFEGEVKRRGRRIDGEAVDHTGASFLFRCDRRQDCELPVSTLGAPSASW
jgi:hypothetical protein